MDATMAQATDCIGIYTRLSREEPMHRLNLLLSLQAVIALSLNGIAAHLLALWPGLEATEQSVEHGCLDFM
jgi:hypothetical protein